MRYGLVDLENFLSLPYIGFIEQKCYFSFSFLHCLGQSHTTLVSLPLPLCKQQLLKTLCNLKMYLVTLF
jgi:hypothetical protein